MIVILELSLDIQFDEKRSSDSSFGRQTLIISDTRDFTVNLSSKLIRQHADGTIGGEGEDRNGDGSRRVQVSWSCEPGHRLRR